MRVYKSCKKGFAALSKALPQLSRPQLEAALYYYGCYPDEIEDRLKSEEESFSVLGEAPNLGIRLGWSATA